MIIMMDVKNQTYKKILKTARDLIVKNPYHAVSLNMIAQRAGVTKPSLYYYFQNKEDLFLKLFDKVSQEFEQKLDKVLFRELPPNKKLHLFIETYINFFFTEKHLIKLLIQRMPQKNKKLCNKMKNTREGIIKKLEEIMKGVLEQEKRNRNVTPRMASMMLLGMLGTFFIEHVETNKNIDISPQKVADQIVSFLGFDN